jgi:hypothetical protein
MSTSSSSCIYLPDIEELTLDPSAPIIPLNVFSKGWKTDSKMGSKWIGGDGFLCRLGSMTIGPITFFEYTIYYFN